MLHKDTSAASQRAWARGGYGRLPEGRLLIAVLRNALLEFEDVVHNHRGANDAQLQELWQWFFGPDDGWLFSFENVCEQLDLDPSCIRARLRALAPPLNVGPLAAPSRIPPHDRTSARRGEPGCGGRQKIGVTAQ